MLKRGSVAVVVGLGAAGALVAGTTGVAVAKTATQTTIFRTGVDSPGTMGVAGNVGPAPRQGGEKVIVRYFKKRADGSWLLLDRKRATLGDASGEGAVFTATMKPSPAKGTCKVVAKYPGDDTYAASRGKRVIDCKTGYPKSTLPTSG